MGTYHVLILTTFNNDEFHSQKWYGLWLFGRKKNTQFKNESKLSSRSVETK